MGQITSNTGLISGLPIQQIIDDLMRVEARPMQLVQERNETLNEQQEAFQRMNTNILSLKSNATDLLQPRTFNPTSASSSNSEVLDVSSTASANPGNYSFSVKQLASSQQMLTRGFSDINETPVGSGTLSFGFGDTGLTPSIKLDELNGGDGVDRGRISITDRSGASSQVDLSTAMTLDDVVSAINGADNVSVHARIEDQGLVIEDQSGGSSSNLIIRNAGGGSTATSLGIAANVEEDAIEGERLHMLGGGTKLSQLNDGLGVERRSEGHNDFEILLGNGDSLRVDVGDAKTIGDVLDRINNHDANEGKVKASVSEDGARLVLEDTTGGGDPIQVRALNNSNAARDLGILGVGEDGAGVFEGERVLSAMDGRLLSRLNGGQGLSFLSDGMSLATQLSSLNGGDGVGITEDSSQSDIKITTRNGENHEVNLDGVRSIGDLASAVETATKGDVTVDVEGDQLRVRDRTSGGGSFSFTDADGSTAASDLGLAFSTSENNHLGEALDPAGGSTIRITNRAGESTEVDLAGVATTSELIQRINDSGAGVTASVNKAGHGLSITDQSGGSGHALQIEDVEGTAAAELNLASSTDGSTLDSGNLNRQAIGRATTLASLNGGDGVDRGEFRITDSGGNSATVQVPSASDYTVGDLVDLINTRGLDVRARVNDEGDGILVEDHGLGASPIRIEEVGGSTARDLGLRGEAEGAGEHLNGSFTRTINVGTDTIDQTTRLSALHGGDGVSTKQDSDDVRITARDGETYEINLDNVQTIGQFMDRVHTATDGQVTAKVNDDGTGLVLTDHTGAEGALSVQSINGSEAAEGLGIASAGSGDTLAGEDLTEQVTLRELAQQINDSGLGVRASIINVGSGDSPYRLSIQGQNTGERNGFIFDDGGLGLDAETMSRARNAVVFYGSPDSPNAVPITSSSNSIRDAIPGTTLDLKSASSEPVNVTIERDHDKVVEEISGFVESFNKVFETFDEYDYYDRENEERGLLLGDSTILRARSSLQRLVNQRHTDVEGRYQTLTQVGIRIGEGGKIELNEDRLREALETDREAVVELFTLRKTERDETTDELNVVESGAAAALDSLLDRMTDSNGLFQRRIDSLDTQKRNNDRTVERMEDRLEAKRKRMESQFNSMEKVLAGLQDQQAAIGQMSPMQLQ